MVPVMFAVLNFYQVHEISFCFLPARSFYHQWMLKLLEFFFYIFFLIFLFKAFNVNYINRFSASELFCFLGINLFDHDVGDVPQYISLYVLLIISLKFLLLYVFIFTFILWISAYHFSLYSFLLPGVLFWFLVLFF